MLKSSRLVAIIGILLGLSVTLLPLGSHATTATQTTVAVSATIDGYLAFTATAHAAGTDVSYEDNKYSATMGSNSYNATFGTTTYEVVCNYLSSTDYEDENGDTPSSCSNGWKVTAVASNYSGTYATMEPTNASNGFKIQSNKANGLTGTAANWLMKVDPISKTIDGNNYAPSAYTATGIDFSDWESIPYTNSSNKVVATGNTFDYDDAEDVYTYLGEQEFKVIYGVSTGSTTPADTYTGTITYTLTVNAAS